MKFITLFAGALAATTAANIFLTSDAYAVTLPNGWTQMGKSCSRTSLMGHTQTYYKLIKTGTTGTYGVYQSTNSTWDDKNISLEKANANMNSKCGVKSYQPT
jgi:hypothetical protein